MSVVIDTKAYVGIHLGNGEWGADLYSESALGTIILLLYWLY